jgi:hypothetical protein
MDEKNLLELWNRGRSQIIHAQLAPSILLLGILALAATGYFDDATAHVQYLAIGITAATGILAVISQYAAIRDGQALTLDLQKLENPSNLAVKIRASGGLLSLSSFATIGLSLAVYAVVILAVLS